MAGMVKIDVKGATYGEINDVLINKYPKVAKASFISSVNTVARTIKSRSIRGISKSAKITPMKLIRQRMPLWKANRKRLRAGIFFHYNPMSLELLAGKNGVKWNPKKGGVKVKKHFIKGAFAANPTKGKHAGKRKRVYKRVSRTGDPRTDLHAQYITLDKFTGILPKTAQRVVNQKMSKEFRTQLNWRLEKHIAKANG